MRDGILGPPSARLRLSIALVAAALVFALAGGNILALSTRNVALARQLAGWSPATVSKEAELLAQNPGSLKMLPAVEVAAIRAVSREPLDFKAARTLATIAVRQNDLPLARKLFSAVGSRTLREPLTHFWLMGDDYARGRHSSFVREAEIILRQKPEMTPQIFLLFTRLVDRNLARQHLLKRLETNPEWRTRYLGQEWGHAKVRGSNFNYGDGLRMAMELGAMPWGHWGGCHATPIVAEAPDYGVRNMIRFNGGSDVVLGTANAMNLEPQGGWELILLQAPGKKAAAAAPRR